MLQKTPRIVDPEAITRFKLEMLGEPCMLCERRPGSDAHHVMFRSQGGHDTADNLVWLCRSCHDGLHAGRLDRHTFV